MSTSRIYPAQWQLAVTTLQTVMQQGRAADRLLQAAFREQRAMGGRDRARVTALVYGVLRDLRRLRRIADTDDATRLCAVHALEAQMTDIAGLERLGVADASALAGRLTTFDAASLSDAERLNLPDAVHARWQETWGVEQTTALAQALLRQAPVDLRVNTLRATPAQVLAALEAANVVALPTPYAPLGLRLSGRAPLQTLPAYHDGWVEPQDEGSQLLALLVQAQPGERVADWCAGAGGKTLALAAAMENRGELWAMDTEASRLQRLMPRLQRAGVGIVSMQVHDDTPRTQTFDAVLVDAPCSATGTWRRQPEARLKTLDLPALTQVQGQILAAAADAVGPGGRLVYATCSLLPDENERVVEAFLNARTDFESVDAETVLRSQGVQLPGRYLQLHPHQHGTDGFFGACLRRRT